MPQESDNSGEELTTSDLKAVIQSEFIHMFARDCGPGSLILPHARTRCFLLDSRRYKPSGCRELRAIADQFWAEFAGGILLMDRQLVARLQLAGVAINFVEAVLCPAIYWHKNATYKAYHCAFDPLTNVAYTSNGRLTLSSEHNI